MRLFGKRLAHLGKVVRVIGETRSVKVAALRALRAAALGSGQGHTTDEAG
jgi:hypothetical protein